MHYYYKEERQAKRNGIKTFGIDQLNKKYSSRHLNPSQRRKGEGALHESNKFSGAVEFRARKPARAKRVSADTYAPAARRKGKGSLHQLNKLGIGGGDGDGREGTVYEAKLAT